MAKLKPGKKLPRSVRCIAKKQLDRAICDLDVPSHQPKGERIHDARKHLKKVRAELRMVRDELGRKVYKRDAAHFRKVAQSLSPQRDAQVKLKTVEKLLGTARGKEACEALMKLHREFQKLMREVSQPNGDGKKWTHKLCVARKHANNWPVGAIKWNDLACGIGVTYQRGSKAAQRALRTRAAGDLHEWRKRVKDLWYQLAFLKPPREQPVAAIAERMKRLGQLLGDDHDLFMIEDAAEKTAELTCREKDAIAKLTKPQRARLQKQAFRSGQQLFGEKPSVFVRRMKRYGEPPPQIANGAN